jgi:hypothetical protein
MAKWVLRDKMPVAALYDIHGKLFALQAVLGEVRDATDYDFEKAADHIRATAYPQAEALAVRYIVNPPTEDESLKMFAGSEPT